MQSHVATEIRALFAEAVGVAAADVDLHRPLLEYGADSLVLLGCIEKVRERWNVEISVGDLMRELTDLSKVIAFIEAQAPRAPAVTPTESLAMMHAASVSGFYLALPEATYFNVGKIGRDQLQDQAARRATSETELERLLAPNL